MTDFLAEEASPCDEDSKPVGEDPGDTGPSLTPEEAMASQIWKILDIGKRSAEQGVEKADASLVSAQYGSPAASGTTEQVTQLCIQI